MPFSPDPDISVTRNDGAHRYEVRVGGELAGFAEYHDRASRGVRTFTHTVVEPAFEGRGLGGRLAQAALDDTRASGLSVVPLCPFIAAYIREHPEYADLVHADR